MQDIAQAEADAKRRTEEASAAGQEEIAAFQESELKRSEKRKAELKEEMQKALEAEEEACAMRLEEGAKIREVKREELRSEWKKKEMGVVAELVEKFLSLAS